MGNFKATWSWIFFALIPAWIGIYFGEMELEGLGEGLAIVFALFSSLALPKGLLMDTGALFLAWRKL
jgi:hypothetical protein